MQKILCFLGVLTLCLFVSACNEEQAEKKQKVDSVQEQQIEQGKTEFYNTDSARKKLDGYLDELKKEK